MSIMIFKCPKCGANLDPEKWKCAYCGAFYVVIDEETKAFLPGIKIDAKYISQFINELRSIFHYATDMSERDFPTPRKVVNNIQKAITALSSRNIPLPAKVSRALSPLKETIKWDNERRTATMRWMDRRLRDKLEGIVYHLRKYLDELLEEKG